MPAEGPDAAKPCYRFAVAPRFSMPGAFDGRFERNGGVHRDGDRVWPLADWRVLPATEVTSLVSGVSGRDAILPPTHLGLLKVPDHLRAGWWAEAERSGGVTPAAGAHFEGIFSKVVDFLRFKRLPLPERVALKVAVSVPGLSSTRVATAGGPQGLSFGDAADTAEAGGGKPVACINFGDEGAYVVLLDLPPAAMATRLEAAGVALPQGLAPAALVRRYFEAFPQQPLLRLRLEPGEGLWLSPLGVVHDGWTDGKLDLDVMLLVGCQTPSLRRSTSPTGQETGVPEGL